MGAFGGMYSGPRGIECACQLVCNCFSCCKLPTGLLGIQMTKMPRKALFAATKAAVAANCCDATEGPLEH